MINPILVEFPIEFFANPHSYERRNYDTVKQRVYRIKKGHVCVNFNGQYFPINEGPRSETSGIYYVDTFAVAL